ncbi:response regulator [Pedobacter sp.]|uniref:response regulator n=1 Tax=Pedobacter sp. TaxID=1411316 RepID=UPI003BAB2FB7
MITKILIADDHNMLINGLKLILAIRTDYEVVGAAYNGFEVLDMVQAFAPDILLLDINMPLLNGFQTLKKLNCIAPETKVIALSMLSDKRTVLSMLENGAKGYLLKNTDDRDLFQAIDQVSQGLYFVSPLLSEILNEYLKGGRGDYGLNRKLLSDREVEIVRLIVDGFTNAEIADRLFLSVRTVDTHRKNIFHKLSVNNTASLVRHALENKIFLGLDA